MWALTGAVATLVCYTCSQKETILTHDVARLIEDSRLHFFKNLHYGCHSTVNHIKQKRTWLSSKRICLKLVVLASRQTLYLSSKHVWEPSHGAGFQNSRPRAMCSRCSLLSLSLLVTKRKNACV